MLAPSYTLSLLRREPQDEEEKKKQEEILARFVLFRVLILAVFSLLICVLSSL